MKMTKADKIRETSGTTFDNDQLMVIFGECSELYSSQSWWPKFLSLLSDWLTEDSKQEGWFDPLSSSAAFGFFIGTLRERGRQGLLHSYKDFEKHL